MGPRVRGTSPLTTLAFAVSGAGAGLLLQVYRSSRGISPFVPPLSLPVTLVVLGAAILLLGILLRRRVTRDTGGNVDPFAAVRILAAARAAQFAGALLGGFGGGLALSLLTRSVPAPSATWVPMLLVLGAGAVLLVAGAVAEHLCRLPPGDDEPPGGEETDGRDPGTGPADQPAFHRP